jgi:hypothetical protein
LVHENLLLCLQDYREIWKQLFFAINPKKLKVAKLLCSAKHAYYAKLTTHKTRKKTKVKHKVEKNVEKNGDSYALKTNHIEPMNKATIVH